jgi:hypothetical protein
VYTIDSHDRVRELSDVAFPASEAPAPLLLADAESLVVTYTATTATAGDTSDSPQPSPDGIATIVVFRHCYASHFGPPHEEAFSSHPLADRGLRPYGAFEVQHSSWLRELEFRTRGNPRQDPGLFEQLRHWVWTFHDSVLECAAMSYVAMEAQGHPDGLLARMHAQLRSS